MTVSPRMKQALVCQQDILPRADEYVAEGRKCFLAPSTSGLQDLLDRLGKLSEGGAVQNRGRCPVLPPLHCRTTLVILGSCWVRSVCLCVCVHLKFVPIVLFWGFYSIWTRRLSVMEEVMWRSHRDNLGKKKPRNNYKNKKCKRAFWIQGKEKNIRKTRTASSLTNLV